MRFELLMVVKMSEKRAVPIFNPPKCWYLPVSPHAITIQKKIDMEIVNKSVSFCFLVFIKVCSV